ncbi:MAG: hypothetical protein ACRCV9_02910 [Burkholderiaceae bacterium]
MSAQSEEFTVLESGDDGSVVSIRGREGLHVLLSGAYVTHLSNVAKRAESELVGLLAYRKQPGLQLLYAEVQTLVSVYQETCNKFEGGVHPSFEIAALTEELAQLRSAFESKPI